ncbi:MAG: DinB family protein [Candidatus Nanopelagicaceae bacterium]|nr:DinB family protein [Candidatus Nanopelagicaceae bacterium]
MKITPTSFETELIDSANHLVRSASSSLLSGNGWSPIVILGHVSDVDEQVWLARINLTVRTFRANEPRPTFAWWEPDPQATQLKYEKYSLDEAAAHLLSARKRVISTLNALDAQDWNAQASHATFGLMHLADIIEKILIHDKEHLASLE